MNPEDLVVHHGSHARPNAQRGDSLLVVSWNIQHGLEVEKAAADLAARTELRNADIVLLQEMDELGTVRVAESLGLDYVYATTGAHPHSGRNFGNAVLSRWPMGQPEATLLPHKAAIGGHLRVVVGSTVSVAGTRIHACSVHTEIPSLSSGKRLRQFEEVAAVASRWSGELLVLGGDFNTVTRRSINALADRMASAGAARASVGAGTTLRRGGQEFTLDHIFVRGLVPDAAGVVPETEASDHRPLWVRLRAPEPGVTTEPAQALEPAATTEPGGTNDDRRS